MPEQTSDSNVPAGRNCSLGFRSLSDASQSILESKSPSDDNCEIRNAVFCFGRDNGARNLAMMTATCNQSKARTV